MLEFIIAGFTFLILVLTALIAWHQILRTPQSDVEVTALDREDPFIAESHGWYLGAPPLQIYNTGEMDAAVTGVEVSYRLRNVETDEPFEITKFETFEVILEPNEIGDGGSIRSGANTRTRAEINIRRMELFPRDIEVRIQYSITVRDIRGTHELQTAHELRIQNRMAKQ